MEDPSPVVTPPLQTNSSWDESTTADSYGKTTEAHYMTFTIARVGLNLRVYLYPVTFCLGVFGNIMTIVIMRRTKAGDSTISIYFTAVAAMDLVVLCIGTLWEWVHFTFGFRLYATHTAVCKLSTWMYTACGTISAWYLVCMTAHRAMSVVWPHRVNLLCTRRTVLLVLFGIALFFALLYSDSFMGMVVMYDASYKMYSCVLKSDNENYMYYVQYVFVYIELAVYSLLPFLFMGVSNSVLIWKLTVSVKTAGKFLSGVDSKQVQAREKAARSVTVSVVTVSLAFLALTLPASIFFILHYFAMFGYALVGYKYAALTFIAAVCQVLLQSNIAINFYLYCLTGRRFREEFIQIMRCGRNRRRHGDYQ